MAADCLRHPTRQKRIALGGFFFCHLMLEQAIEKGLPHHRPGQDSLS
jgi:hypothetical protein